MNSNNKIKYQAKLLKFTCNTCRQSLPLFLLTEKITKICSQNSNIIKLKQNSNNSNPFPEPKECISLYNNINNIVANKHYCKMEASNILVLAYIFHQQYDKALEIMQICTMKQFYFSYPSNSLMIAIQELQLKKLLNFFGHIEKDIVCSHFKSSSCMSSCMLLNRYKFDFLIDIFKSAYGLHHEMTINAISIFYDG